MVRYTSPWHRFRKLFNDLHLWMGLASGIVLIAVCLSGTIYVYNTELQEMASPHLYKVQGRFEKSDRLQTSQLILSVQKQSGGNVSSITVPHDPQRTYQVNVRTENDKSRFGTTYFLHPYTGEIVGTSLEKSSVTAFMGYMFSLHRWLLLDKIDAPIVAGLENRKLGSYITGTATILFTLGALTGLVLWFPKKIKSWKQGLKIKWQASWKRTNHDLHNTLGFYSFALLFLMGVTGPQWSFDWYRDGLRKVLGTEASAPKGRTAISRQETGRTSSKAPRVEKDKAEKTMPDLLPLEDYLIVANKTLPYAGDYRISLPTSAKDPIQLSKTRVGFFAPAASDQVKLNVHTASIEEISIFREKPLNERIASSIKAIHIGNVYGSFTKLLYFFACLIATSLPITGTLIWLNKMKKKPKTRKIDQAAGKTKHAVKPLLG